MIDTHLYICAMILWKAGLYPNIQCYTLEVTRFIFKRVFRRQNKFDWQRTKIHETILNISWLRHCSQMVSFFLERKSLNTSLKVDHIWIQWYHDAIYKNLTFCTVNLNSEQEQGCPYFQFYLVLERKNDIWGENKTISTRVTQYTGHHSALSSEDYYR